MLCGENDVGAHGTDVDNMEKGIHDGVLRTLRREGHRPRETAVEVREQFKNNFVSPDTQGKCMHALDMLLRTKTYRQAGILSVFIYVVIIVLTVCKIGQYETQTL